MKASDMDKLRNHNQWLPIPQTKYNYTNKNQSQIGYNNRGRDVDPSQQRNNANRLQQQRNKPAAPPAPRQQHVAPIQMYQYWHTYPPKEEQLPGAPPRPGSKKKDKRKEHPIATTSKQYNPLAKMTFREMVGQ